MAIIWQKVSTVLVASNIFLANSSYPKISLRVPAPSLCISYQWPSSSYNTPFCVFWNLECSLYKFKYNIYVFLKKVEKKKKCVSEPQFVDFLLVETDLSSMNWHENFMPILGVWSSLRYWPPVCAAVNQITQGCNDRTRWSYVRNNFKNFWCWVGKKKSVFFFQSHLSMLLGIGS